MKLKKEKLIYILKNQMKIKKTMKIMLKSEDVKV